jgi:hypothetical protein
MESFSNRYGGIIELDPDQLGQLELLAAAEPPEAAVSVSSLLGDALTQYIAKNQGEIAAAEQKLAAQVEAEAKAAELAAAEAKANTPGPAGEAAAAYLAELKA